MTGNPPVEPFGAPEPIDRRAALARPLALTLLTPAAAGVRGGCGRRGVWVPRTSSAV